MAGADQAASTADYFKRMEAASYLPEQPQQMAMQPVMYSSAAPFAAPFAAPMMQLGGSLQLSAAPVQTMYAQPAPQVFAAPQPVQQQVYAAPQPVQQVYAAPQPVQQMAPEQPQYVWAAAPVQQYTEPMATTQMPMNLGGSIQFAPGPVVNTVQAPQYTQMPTAQAMQFPGGSFVGAPIAQPIAAPQVTAQPLRQLQPTSMLGGSFVAAPAVQTVVPQPTAVRAAVPQYQQYGGDIPAAASAAILAMPGGNYAAPSAYQPQPAPSVFNQAFPGGSFVGAPVMMQQLGGSMQFAAAAPVMAQPAPQMAAPIAQQAPVISQLGGSFTFPAPQPAPVAQLGGSFQFPVAPAPVNMAPQQQQAPVFTAPLGGSLQFAAAPAPVNMMPQPAAPVFTAPLGGSLQFAAAPMAPQPAPTVLAPLGGSFQFPVAQVAPMGGSVQFAVPVGPDPAQRKCDAPGCENPGISMCSRCKARAYCCVECQTKDWPAHKPHCTPVA